MGLEYSEENDVFTKKRNLLHIEKKCVLRLKPQQSLEVRVDKLIDTRSSVVIS